MQETDEDSAFRFTGRWQDYAPIAFTNLLLTIVTLGIYRFWATTRTRQYLWSQTQFIDDALEWTGTGKELFLGFLAAFFLFVLPLVLIQLGLQALAMRGHLWAVGLAGVTLYFGILYLIGLARFRALRYRLTRTYWRGIRGGSDDQGLRYGLTYVWMTLVGVFAAGLLIPWSMVRLWNERWSKMSFGSESIGSASMTGPVFKRFLLFYLIPVVLFVVLLAVTAMTAGMSVGAAPAILMLGGAGVLFIYIGLPLIAVSYYAVFFRNAVGHMRWANLNFAFEARTQDWLKFILGTIGLVIVTLGVAIIFIPYRNWAFFIRHLHAYGEINVEALAQSETPLPTQGEGLLDAFDIGAI